MKYFNLDKEEEQIVKDFDEKKLVSIATAKDEADYQRYAAQTLNKTKNINIRLSEKDLQKLKIKAAETGIPYQTLVSSVLHRFAIKDEVSN